MSCNITREQLIEYHYHDGPWPEEREKLRAHIAQCPACTKTLEDLASTSRILSAWSDETPDLNMVFVEDRRSFVPTFIKRHPWRWAIGTAATLAAVLTLFFLNFEFSYQNGTLHASLGLRNAQPEPAEKPDATADTPDLNAPVTWEELIAYQREAFAATQQRIRESEARQRSDVNTALTRLVRGLEQQRRQDLNRVDHNLQILYETGQQRHTQWPSAAPQPQNPKGFVLPASTP